MNTSLILLSDNMLESVSGGLSSGGNSNKIVIDLKHHVTVTIKGSVCFLLAVVGRILGNYATVRQ